jgi:hypothetical protein
VKSSEIIKEKVAAWSGDVQSTEDRCKASLIYIIKTYVMGNRLWEAVVNK